MNTRSSPGRLGLFSKRISVVSIGFRRQIVEKSQAFYTYLTMESIRASATRLTLYLEQKSFLEGMLSEKYTHLFTVDKRYLPKTYGCLFYVMKTVLLRLREEKVLICLKSIVKGGKPFHILFQSEKEGEEFQRVPDIAYKTFKAETRIVVFEAVVGLERELAAKKLEQAGFTETILACTAKEAPYERGSELNEVLQPEAFEEIKLYREKGIGTYLTLDHVFTNTLDKEHIE